MLKEQTFNTGVVELNYAEGPPSGPSLVMLHGFTGRWQGFLPLVPALSMRWQIFAPDYRGHGKSGRVRGRYIVEDYLSDLEAFVDGVLVAPVVLIGHSIGGLFAVALAERIAEDARAVIVGDVPLSAETWAALPTNEEAWARLRDLAGPGQCVAELASSLADLPVPGQDPPMKYGDLPDISATSLREWAKTLGQLDPSVMDWHAEGRRDELLVAFDFERMLRGVTCPVLLLQADPSEGGIMADDDVQYAMSLLADACHVQIKGAGHDLGLATWDVAPLLTAVMEFLESL
jgi:pimeloyl-ACP methyl ester carboxylesterase